MHEDAVTPASRHTGFTVMRAYPKQTEPGLVPGAGCAAQDALSDFRFLFNSDGAGATRFPRPGNYDTGADSNATRRLAPAWRHAGMHGRIHCTRAPLNNAFSSSTTSMSSKPNTTILPHAPGPIPEVPNRACLAGR